MGWDNRRQTMQVLRRFINNTAPSKIEATTREIANFAIEKATEFSPFDSGCFMASWRVSLSQNVGGPAPPGRRADEYTAATEAVSASAGVIKRIKMGQTFYLGNNVHYADFVEFGGPNVPAYHVTARVAQSIGGVYGRIYINP